MRKFSDFEKKVINKILDLHSKYNDICAYNVFFDLQSANTDCVKFSSQFHS